MAGRQPRHLGKEGRRDGAQRMSGGGDRVGGFRACTLDCEAQDLALVAAVARTHAGRVLGDVLGEPRLTAHIYASAAAALAHPCDVFVEYTSPDSAKTNILTALEHGAHVVVGTSGLTENDFAQIDALARTRHRGVSPVATLP